MSELNALRNSPIYKLIMQELNGLQFDGFATQVGTDPPFINTRINNYGRYTTTYEGIGVYHILFENPLILPDTTFPNAENPLINTDASGNIIMVYPSTNYVMVIETYDNTETPSNGILNKKHIYFNTTFGLNQDL